MSTGVFRYRFIPPPFSNPGGILGTSIRSAVGAADGVAIVTGVGASTHAATGAAADGVAIVTGVGASTHAATGAAADGVATASAVGTGILSGAGAADGVATVSGIGAVIFSGVGSAAGTATVTGIAIILPVTSTKVLNKPIDYVLAGQQMKFKTGRAMGAALRHTFNE